MGKQDTHSIFQHSHTDTLTHKQHALTLARSHKQPQVQDTQRASRQSGKDTIRTHSMITHTHTHYKKHTL